MGLTVAISSEFTVLMVTCLFFLGSGRCDTQLMALGSRGDTSAHLDGPEKLLKGGAYKVVSDRDIEGPLGHLPWRRWPQAGSPGGSMATKGAARVRCQVPPPHHSREASAVGLRALPHTGT